MLLLSCLQLVWLWLAVSTLMPQPCRWTFPRLEPSQESLSWCCWCCRSSFCSSSTGKNRRENSRPCWPWPTLLPWGSLLNILCQVTYQPPPPGLKHSLFPPFYCFRQYEFIVLLADTHSPSREDQSSNYFSNPSYHSLSQCITPPHVNKGLFEKVRS